LGKLTPQKKGPPKRRRPRKPRALAEHRDTETPTPTRSPPANPDTEAEKKGDQGKPESKRKSKRATELERPPRARTKGGARDHAKARTKNPKRGNTNRAGGEPRNDGKRHGDLLG